MHCQSCKQHQERQTGYMAAMHFPSKVRLQTQFTVIILASQPYLNTKLQGATPLEVSRECSLVARGGLSNHFGYLE